MKIKLKANKVFRTTVDIGGTPEDVIVGGEPVEVSDKAGKYLLETFPQILELAKKPEKES